MRKDIQKKTKEILDGKFDVKEIKFVPQLKDLTLGNTGVKFKAAVLFIDMRGSTKVLNNHNRDTVGKLHMCFFHAIVKIANEMGGNVRSFNGDSSLIFFQGNKEVISIAVKCAMKIKFMLSNSEHGINKLMKKYRELDFGIGVDYGEILCTKVGIAGEHNRDLFWIGNCVNRSTVLGDSGESPYHVSISKFVYEQLIDNVKYGKRLNDWGIKVTEDMWDKDSIKYNGKREACYRTSWHFSVY